MATGMLARRRHIAGHDRRTVFVRSDRKDLKPRVSAPFPTWSGGDVKPEGRAEQVLERQLARTESVEKATDRIIPWLFHRNGNPIKSFRRAWITACKSAKVPGRIPHDFRRTAIRNLERAGIPRSATMAMVGHKTESVYRRYAIVEEGMLNEAGAKLQTFYDNAQVGPASVVRFPRARARHGAKA